MIDLAGQLYICIPDIKLAEITSLVCWQFAIVSVIGELGLETGTQLATESETKCKNRAAAAAMGALAFPLWVRP